MKLHVTYLDAFWGINGVCQLQANLYVTPSVDDYSYAGCQKLREEIIADGGIAIGKKWITATAIICYEIK